MRAIGSKRGQCRMEERPSVRRVEPWANNVSRRELIRDGCDQESIVDLGNLRLIFQGMWDKDRSGKGYGQFHWRIGTL